MEKEEVGVILNYFAKIGVAAIKLSNPLKVGDKVYVEAKKPFEQTIESIQIEHKEVQEVPAGQSMGTKIMQTCHKGDRVYKILGSE